MKYFDTKNERLVFEEQKADEKFWDEYWNIKQFRESILKESGERFFVEITKKYLNISRPNERKILEAGCGKGQLVYALSIEGYDVSGIDYAENTVCKVNKLFPDLKISFGDVRKTEFPDNYFDGYWSRGVIEHFYEGYDEIMKEAFRILRPGGYLFLTFPYMSPVRKLKAKMGKYPLFIDEKVNREKFFQFALNHNKVLGDLKNKGFKLLKKKPYNGMKGLRDESELLQPFLEKIYLKKNIFLRIFRYLISKLASSFASHSILLVLRKK